MKFYSAFLLMASLLALNACQLDMKPSYFAFPEEKILVSSSIMLDSIELRYPFRIRIIDNLAVVLDLHGYKQYCHVFSYPDFRYLNSFGHKGEAPKEMLSADNIRIKDGAFWTLDANKREINIYHKRERINSFVCSQSIALDPIVLRPLDFTFGCDSNFVIPDYSGQNRFCIVNMNGKLVRKVGFIPSYDSSTPNDCAILAQAWRSFIDYNPHNDVLALVTQLGEVLEIYHLKDSTHITQVGIHGEPQFKYFGNYAVPSGIMGFSDVQVTDSAIYTVFHGRTFKEISRQVESRRVDGGRFIYVFSLQGKPLCKYILDKFVYGIHVDEKRRIITATDVNNEHSLAVFKI